MREKKEFDCVEMKNQIQQALRKHRMGMLDEEIEAQMVRELEQSPSPMAQLWRKIKGERQEVQKKGQRRGSLPTAISAWITAN